MFRAILDKILNWLGLGGPKMLGSGDDGTQNQERRILPGKDEPWEYDYDVIAPIGMLKGVPWHALPSFEWLVEVGVRGAQIALNKSLVKKNLNLGESNDDDLADLADTHPLRSAFSQGKATQLADQTSGLRSALSLLDPGKRAYWFREMIESVVNVNDEMQTTVDVAEYNKLFQAIPLPDIANNFQEDSTFANLRVAGPNPTSLWRVPTQGLPTKFPVSNEQYQSVMGPLDSLAAAVREGRLYWVDYLDQQPTLNGTYPSWQKFAFEPMGLFAVPQKTADSGNRDLKAVAIQCGQDPGDYKVYSPSDGMNWLQAKTIIEVADGNFHELIAHLGRTHLVIEPFPVATHNHLESSHPLRTLLEPHFEGTLFINWAAGDNLVAPKGFVDQILSGTIAAGVTVGAKVTASRTFNDSFLPKWLAEQGVDDKETLPNYPFRDDSLLLWEAIGQWVQDYVEIYWPTDAAVQGDTQLQKWAQELASFEGGRVTDFGDRPQGGIQTTSYLVEALQMVIFTASAMHAAVNFPQGDLMDYAPATPTAGYKPAPTTTSQTTEKDWLEFLPPMQQALAQVNILFLLGNVHYTQLGQYENDTFSNDSVLRALTRFQVSLDTITNTIEQRNKHRRPYKYLLPKDIPQSINI